MEASTNHEINEFIAKNLGPCTKSLYSYIYLEFVGATILSNAEVNLIFKKQKDQEKNLGQSGVLVGGAN
jgi:hypothetical protein